MHWNGGQKYPYLHCEDRMQVGLHKGWEFHRRRSAYHRRTITITRFAIPVYAGHRLEIAYGWIPIHCRGFSATVTTIIQCRRRIRWTHTDEWRIDGFDPVRTIHIGIDPLNEAKCGVRLWDDALRVEAYLIIKIYSLHVLCVFNSKTFGFKTSITYYPHHSQLASSFIEMDCLKWLAHGVLIYYISMLFVSSRDVYRNIHLTWHQTAPDEIKNVILSTVLTDSIKYRMSHQLYIALRL